MASPTSAATRRTGWPPSHARLGALGAAVTETEDGLRIQPRPLQPNLFHTYADHRMVMAGAVLALRCPGLVVEDAGTVAKTLPEFTQLWHHLVSPSTSAANA